MTDISGVVAGASAAPALRRAALLALLLSTAATPGLAQTGPTTPDSTETTSTGQPATTSGTAAATPVDATPRSDAALSDAGPRDAPNAGGQLADIVVTATKRETNLQKTPIAISVVSTQALDDRHVQSLADLADGSVPGLRVATFEARQSALTIGIRGIVPLDANQPAREQGVGVYVDGVYLGRQQGLGAALLDVDRIEVLKGPQGTLFGRNTEGGALSIVTKAPTGRLGLRVTGGIGNYGAYNADGHLDLPAAGPFSLKLDGAVSYQDATTKNPLPGNFGFNYYDRIGAQAKLRFRPSDTFTADLSADIGKDKNTPFYSQLLNFNPNNYPVGPLSGTLPAGSVRPVPPIVTIEGGDRMKTVDILVPQRPSVDKTRGTALNVKWSVAPSVELRSITAYREVSVDQWDNSGGAHRPPLFTPNGTFSRYSLSYLTQHQFSQEFQAVGNIGGNLDYVAGLYYFNEKAQEEAATPSSLRWNATGTAYTVLDLTNTLPGLRSIDRGSRARSKSYAAYGQATYTPPAFDVLHITLGGRYTRDTKTGALYLVNNAPTNFLLDQNTKRFNPLAIIAYDVSPRVHLYAKYATGYRSGGASSRSLIYRQFGPEDVKSYEVGAKTELFDRRVRLNVAGYVMDRKGSQVDFSVLTPVGNSTRNTLETINAPGSTKIRGIELDALARVTDRLSLTAAYAYTYTKVPDTVNPFNGRLERVFIPFTPRNVANGAIDYVMPIGTGETKLRFHIDGNYNQAAQSFAEFATENDASFIVNGRIALADMGFGGGDGKVTLSLWARNLLDETHVYRRDPTNSLPNPFTNCVAGVLGDYGNFNAPRTFGVEAAIKL